MRQEKVEIIISEKKVWEIPSLEKLEVIQTLGGGGDREEDLAGPS